MNRDELRNDVRAEYPDENWDTECAGFAYLVCRLSGTVRRAYASATDARNASQIVSTDMAAAPAGAFHHWSYWARLNGVYKDWGHVAAALGGGRAVMTNPEWNEWDWGICLGETDVAAWTARRRGIVTYMGWSYTYGENTANITTDTTAGGNARPFEEDDMYTTEDADRDKATAKAVELIRAALLDGQERTGLSIPKVDTLYAEVGDTHSRLFRVGPNGVPYDIFQWMEKALATLLDAAGKQPVTVELDDEDRKALAQSIAIMLPGMLAPLSDEDVARIAQAAADEQAKRLAK